MAITKMFRDRVVSMEQTWDLGEKYLGILGELIADALPGFRVVGNDFDHDRDFYWLDVKNAETEEERRVYFTRMVLADRDCVPLMVEEPHAPVRARLVEAIRAQAGAAEVVVAYRAVLSDEEKAEAELTQLFLETGAAEDAVGDATDAVAVVA